MMTTAEAETMQARTQGVQAQSAEGHTGEMQNSKKKETMKEIGFFVLSFLAPVLLMAFIWGNLGITYGGEVIPLTYDMQAQYMPFYASLRYILSGENSLFFSWSFFLGSNYLGAYALDLASPLSWITVLWDLEHMPDAIYVLTLLKIGLCGLSFAFFTRFGLSEKTERRCGMANVLFACCYALMSYNIMYSVCLPWLEEVMLLPIILLGIEKLLQGKKGFLYFVSIAGAFICNYYISYMVGVFAAIYILCRVGAEITKENRKEMLWALLRFGANTVFALGISMPLVLPSILNLLGNMRKESGYQPGSYEFGILQLLQKLLPGQYDSFENWGLPSIYCGSIMLALAVAYFFFKQYGIREKVFYLIMAAVVFSGFLWKEMDFIWHGFQYPHSVPYRYAFCFCGVVLILAWKAYVQLPLQGSFARLITVILGCYLCVELFFNGFAVASGIHKEKLYSVRSRYNQVMEYVLPLAEEVREEEGFCRAESMTGYLSYNENLFFGLKGIGSFHSASNAGVQNFLYVMGTPYRYAASTGDGLSPVGDSLLGLKYRITGSVYLPGYEVKDVVEGMSGQGGATIRLYLHENKNALSLGYLADADAIMESHTFGADIFENQNRILEILGVEEPEVFRKIDLQITGEGNNRTVKFTPSSDNPVFCCLLAQEETAVKEDGEWKRSVNGAQIHLAGEGLEGNANIPLRSAQYLGDFEPGKELVMDVTGDNLTYYEEEIYLYELDLEKYEAAMQELKAGELEVASCRGGHILGKVTAKEGQALLLTIPQDGGYTVKVDGEPGVQGYALGTFLEIRLTEGEHQIEITYLPPGFKQGAMAGGIAAAAAVLYYAFSAKKLRRGALMQKNR